MDARPRNMIHPFFKRAYKNQSVTVGHTDGKRENSIPHPKQFSGYKNDSPDISVHHSKRRKKWNSIQEKKCAEKYSKFQIRRGIR